MQKRMIKNKYLLIKLRIFCLKKLKQFVSSSEVPPIHNTQQLAIRMSSPNDTLLKTIIAEMDTLQKTHMALEEEEAYEEARWADELMAEKKAALEKAQQALTWAEMDLDSAKKTYDRIKNVPRSQRRGKNFKTDTTLGERLETRGVWESFNKVLKSVGKEQQALQYLDRPWRLEN